MSENKLKPCPFCRSNTVNDTSIPVDPEWEKPMYYWVCPECCTSGPICETLEEATKQWNTRTPNKNAEVLEMVEDLDECIDDLYHSVRTEYRIALKEKVSKIKNLINNVG